VYMFVGLAGVPVFAGLIAGPVALINPPGGFILSFIVVAFVTGLITRGHTPINTSRYTVAAFAGLFVNYLIGVTYMYFAMNIWLKLPISYIVAWTGMIPFFIKDSLLSILAALFFVSFTKRVP